MPSRGSRSGPCRNGGPCGRWPATSSRATSPLRRRGAVPRTVLLIDGYSLTYRAFFALPTDLATASGQVTNAVFGFTSMLVNIVKERKPDAIAVAFDLPKPTFRHERLATYKGTRES